MPVNLKGIKQSSSSIKISQIPLNKLACASFNLFLNVLISNETLSLCFIYYFKVFLSCIFQGSDEPIRGYRKDTSSSLLSHMYTVVRTSRQPRRSILQSLLRMFDDHKVNNSLKQFFQFCTLMFCCTFDIFEIFFSNFISRRSYCCLIFFNLCCCICIFIYFYICLSICLFVSVHFCCLFCLFACFAGLHTCLLVSNLLVSSFFLLACLSVCPFVWLVGWFNWLPCHNLFSVCITLF